MSELVPATQSPEPVRRFMTTVSDNPVMDTAAYEHMARIAKTMAMSGMMHKTLTWGKNEHGQDVPLPGEVVAARAFLIVEQAVRWRQSPMAVMQSASFVHGRLMWEGKLVSAILTEVFGIELDYKFGVWDAKLGKVITSADGQEPGESDLLGVIVTERGGDPSRYVEGYVGGWKTTGNGSPWKAGAMKRQLRYRGAREWSRAFRSSAILGIVTDDEPIEHNDAPQPVLKGRGGKLAEKLTGPATETGGGFDPAQAHRDLDGGAATAAQEAPNAPEGTDAPAGAENAAGAPENGTDAANGGGDEPKTETAGDPDLTVAVDPAKLAAEIQAAEDAKAAADAKTEAPAEQNDLLPVQDSYKPGPLQKYFDIMDTEKDFNGVKAAMVALSKDPDYMALYRADQNGIHRRVWKSILRVDNGQNLHLSQPSAFRFWIDTLDSADEARAAFRALEKAPIFLGMAEASRANFMAIYEGRLKELESV